MRIAFISADSTSLVRGDGTESDDRSRRLAGLASALASAGHTVDVFTRRNDLWSAPIVALAPNANVVQLPAGPPHFVPAAQLPQLMEDFAARLVGACGGGEGYDVVHASCHLSGLAALRLREHCGVPFVISLDDREASPAERRLAATADGWSRSTRASDRLLAKVRREVCADRSDPAGRPAAFAPASVGRRADDSACAWRSSWSCSARASSAAGIDSGIRAIAALRREHAVVARLLVAVETNDLDPCQGGDRPSAGIAAPPAPPGADLQPRRVTGRAARRVRAADAALVPPADERPAPLEAMACGVPVVGADVAALRWAIQSEVTGFLVPPGDPAAVAERLARFRRNPELGRAYGRAGIRRVRAGFTWRHAAAALARIYAAVLSPHHARLATAASR
jgi:glycosyltransferase involved in cell wall biosynthesis